jgi:hypothetical protein
MKVLERFRLRIDNLKAFKYREIYNYLSEHLDFKEQARLLNLEEAYKAIKLEEEFSTNPLRGS